MKKSAKFDPFSLRALFFDATAQNMVEYSLMIVFIALAVVGLLSGIKPQIKGIWSALSNVSHYFY